MTRNQIVVALVILAAVALAVIIIPKTGQPGRPMKPEDQDPPKKQVGEDLIEKAQVPPSPEKRKRPELIAPARPKALVLWAASTHTPYLSAEAVEVATMIGADWAEKIVTRALLRDEDGDFDDSEHAVRALYGKAGRGDKDVLPTLLDLLRIEEEEWETDMWGARTLARIPGDDAFAKLLTLVNREDDDEDATWDAVWAAGARGGDRARDAIKQLLDHSDDEFIAFSAGALLKFEDPDAKKLIDAHFADTFESDWEGEYLAAGLGIEGSSAAIPYLVKLTTDEDEDLRVIVARSLGRTKLKEAIEPLKKLLADENDDVKVVAAAALARDFGLDVGAPIIAARLRSGEDAEICTEAAKALLALNREPDIKIWQEVFDKSTKKEDALILKLWAAYGLLRH
jgi:HEAT repeat protein